MTNQDLVTPENKEWRDLEEFVDSENFAEIMQRDFPREAEIIRQSGMGRRDFLKLMGASVMMGGLTLSGCGPVARSQEEIIPYVTMPEGMIPGRPQEYASSMVMGGYATGVLIETHTGRPTRVDGNANHPASLGASNSMILASIFELYNPDRSVTIRNNGEASDMETFMSALEGVREQLSSGRGLRILTGASTSPALAAQVEDLTSQFSNVAWYQYEPLARDNVHAGAELAFGEVVNTIYNFAEADVILDLDADFLVSLPGSLAYARQFADGRRVRDDAQVMNRLYAIESHPSNTGSVADHRLALRAGDVGLFALALADALGADGGASVSDAPWDTAFLDAVVADLQASGGRSVVVVGDSQPAAVHALGHAINAALGSVGTTVNYTDSVLVNPANSIDDLSAMVADMSSGDVEAVLIVGGNPVYDSPADVGFAGALDRVPFSMHLSLYNNETSLGATWHLPATHFIEGWGDARAYDGTISVIQPPIGAMWDTAHSVHEIIAAIAGDERTGYEIVREANSDVDDVAWRRALHDGHVADSAFEPSSPSLSMPDDLASEITGAGDGLEVIFVADEATYDGRFAYNAWLLELPRAVSKLSWDGVATVSPATADELGVDTGDLVDISLNGRTMQAPILVQKMMSDGAVAVSLGYGTGISAELDAGLSFNAYTIRTTGAMSFASGATVSASGGNYPLAIIQKEFDDMGTHPVRYATLDEFIEHPDFSQEDPTDYKGRSLIPLGAWTYEDGYSWGMSIELTSCIGCNACIMGCTTENNVPSVGKEEVLQERDMHWLRVDRYERPDGGSHYQPVPCMQCESAPCEPVCPVQATVHDHEGINNMVYNRCIGTRSCAANCPYSVRRFNFKEYTNDASILAEGRNPDVSVRVRGVMEKCNYCVQRINAARIAASTNGRPGIMDGDVTPACASACPTQAIVFGNLNDPNARVVQHKAQPLDYSLLEELNTLPRTTYMARVINPNVTLYDGPASWHDEDKEESSEAEAEATE